jgi:DNA-binding transcriptional regulator PaaX
VALGQVRTTCSRLAREGRIATRKEGKTAFYMISKAESEAMTTAPDFDDSPIEASN